MNMKVMQKMIVLALLMVAGWATVMAQPGQGGREMDPAKMAERQTARLQEQLTLSEAQTTKIGAVNLMYANKMQEARAAAGDDRTAMRQTMKTLRTEQEMETKKYLTTEQIATWETVKAEQQEKMAERRTANGKGKGKGKPTGGEGKPQGDGGGGR